MSPLTNEAKEEVQRLLREGRKAEAVAYLQRMFEIAPADALLLTEAAENEMLPHADAVDAAVDTLAPAPSVSGTTPERVEIETLLRANRKIDAVKYVRQRTGMGLKESLRRVEEVEREVNPNFKPSGGCAKGVFKLLAVFFGFVAFMLVGGAGLVHYYQSQLARDENKSTGVVTALRPNTEGNTQAPVIVYVWQGKEYTHESTTYSSPPAFYVNEPVTVYVNPEDPTDIVVDTFSERWLAIVIMGALGIVFVIFSTVFFFVSGRF